MRVINLRGTSGSGKTYIVKRIMEMYDTNPTVHRIAGRKQPTGYTYFRKAWPGEPVTLQDGRSKEWTCPNCGGDSLFCKCPPGTWSPLFVVGHYEGACGGADNLPQGLDYIYKMIYEALGRGEDVIFEGLIVASDVQRCIELKDAASLLVIGLDTSLKECNEAVDQRRLEKTALTGKVPPPLKLNKHGRPKNSEAKFKALIPQRARFKDAGVDFRLLNRADALQACLEFLSLKTV